MEKNKLASHCDMEFLKMAMLKHEETFRHQVHELHRLYRVQKQLMGGGLSRPPPSSEHRLSCRRQIIKRRRRQPRRALDLHRHLRLPADERVIVTPPSSAKDDGLELTLAIGGAGRCRKMRRDETESTGTATPLVSESDDISGGSLTTASSSTDTGGGSPPCQVQGAMPPAFRLQETTTVATQPPRSPWLVQCVSLEMA